MVREESMKELKQRQQRLQERTLWLKEQGGERDEEDAALYAGHGRHLLPTGHGTERSVWSYRRNIRRACCD